MLPQIAKSRIILVRSQYDLRIAIPGLLINALLRHLLIIFSLQVIHKNREVWNLLNGFIMSYYLICRVAFLYKLQLSLSSSYLRAHA